MLASIHTTTLPGIILGIGSYNSYTRVTYTYTYIFLFFAFNLYLLGLDFTKNRL